MFQNPWTFYYVFTLCKASSDFMLCQPNCMFDQNLWIVTFLESQDYGTGFCQPRVHTVMAGWVPVGHEFLPITVWTSGWYNQFNNSDFLERSFSDFTLITWKKGQNFGPTLLWLMISGQTKNLLVGFCLSRFDKILFSNFALFKLTNLKQQPFDKFF